MTCFKQIWLVMRSEVVPLLDPEEMADDFLKAMCSLPLAKIKLDMDIDDLATAADASEAGGGAHASTKLTAMATSRLEEGERQADRPVIVSLYSSVRFHVLMLASAGYLLKVV